MSLAFIDFLTYVLFGLKILAIILASLMFLLGLDDLAGLALHVQLPE